MKPVDLICLGTTIFTGLIYGIFCIVTKKASYRGINYEGKKAVAVGWAIVSIFVFLAIIVVLVELI